LKLEKDHSTTQPLNHIPIVAMTADAMSGVRDKVLEVGMNDYVTKPINPKELFTALVKWIAPGERILPESYQKETYKEEGALPFTELTGIDVETGLKRSSGNPSLYMKLIKRFFNDFQSTTEDIKKAIENNDFTLAQRLAHTTKGVAANIGAIDLQEKSAELEAAIKERRETDSPIGIFSNELRKVMETLAPYVEAEVSEEDKEIGSSEDLKGLLIKLKPFVDKRKLKPCKEIMSEIDSRSWSQDLDAHVRNLSRLLDKYQTKKASELISDILQKI